MGLSYLVRQRLKEQTGSERQGFVKTCWVGPWFGWNRQWHWQQRVLNFWVCASRMFLWSNATVLWWRSWSQVTWMPWMECLVWEKWSPTLVGPWALADGSAIAQLEQLSTSLRCFWNLIYMKFMVCPTYWDWQFLHVIKYIKLLNLQVIYNI